MKENTVEQLVSNYLINSEAKGTHPEVVAFVRGQFHNFLDAIGELSVDEMTRQVFGKFINDEKKRIFTDNCCSYQSLYLECKAVHKFMDWASSERFIDEKIMEGIRPPSDLVFDLPLLKDAEVERVFDCLKSEDNFLAKAIFETMYFTGLLLRDVICFLTFKLHPF